MVGDTKMVNIEAVVKGAKNYPKYEAEKLKPISTSPQTFAQVHRELSTEEKRINQVFEGIDVSLKRFRKYYDQLRSELANIDTEKAKLDSQISVLQTMQKENPSEHFDALIEAYEQKRDAITVKPRENLEKFLEVLRNVAQAFPEP